MSYDTALTKHKQFCWDKEIKTTTRKRITLHLHCFHSAYVHQFFLPKATSCPRISQTLRKSSSSLSSDWWPYITKRWSTFSSSLSTHAHCSMVQAVTLTHTYTQQQHLDLKEKKTGQENNTGQSWSTINIARLILD